MRVLTRYLSVAAAAAVIAVVLVGAKMMAGTEDHPVQGTERGGQTATEPSAGPAAEPAAKSAALSFGYGEDEPAQSIEAPRVGICYPFEGAVATAFRNNTELAAQLYPAADCGGEPGALVAPGAERTGTAAGRGVVFVVPVA